MFFKAIVLGRIFALGQRQTSTVTSSLNVVYVLLLLSSLIAPLTVPFP